MTDELTDKVTIRGLVDGSDYQATPLREFKGKFVSHKAETDTRYNKVKVTLNFSDLQVIETTEPYNLPIAEIPINFSDRKRSKWGILSDSLVKFLKESEDLKDAYGRTLHMKYTPDHNFGKNKQTGEDMVQGAWEVIGIDGATTKVDAVERVIQLLDGKTEAEFGQVVFQDVIVKGDSKVQDSIVNKTMIPSLITAGKVKKDDKGIFHKV